MCVCVCVCAPHGVVLFVQCWSSRPDLSCAGAETTRAAVWRTRRRGVSPRWHQSCRLKPASCLLSATFCAVKAPHETRERLYSFLSQRFKKETLPSADNPAPAVCFQFISSLWFLGLLSQLLTPMKDSGVLVRVPWNKRGRRSHYMKVGQAPPTFTGLLRACLSVNTAVKQPLLLTLQSLECTALDMDLPSSFLLFLLHSIFPLPLLSYFFLFASSFFFPLSSSSSVFLLPFFLLPYPFLLFLPFYFFVLPFSSSSSCSFLFLLFLSSSLHLHTTFSQVYNICTLEEMCSAKGKGCLLAPKTLKTWRTLKRMLIILGG